MREKLHLRQAVRAVILDDAQRILLAHFEFPPDHPQPELWAAPGGGIEEDEDERVALDRELAEEVGLTDVAIGPLIWTRTHILPLSTGHDGQQEHYYLVRTPAFDPAPELTEQQLRAERVVGLRWWSPQELTTANTAFAPRRLPSLVEALLADGPPPHPIDVGV